MVESSRNVIYDEVMNNIEAQITNSKQLRIYISYPLTTDTE